MATGTTTKRARSPDVSARSPAPGSRGAGAALGRLVLGPALPTARLAHERLGKPTALAVFASDNLSSSAYATEEILKVGVPAVGAAAFAIVMPVTIAILGVLAILLFSYRQTIRAYPSAGGAYVVTRDNFGLVPAQVAGVALMTDYVLTVAVSISAGVAAITSVAPALVPYRVALALGFVWLLAWGNLRGLREAGRLFMLPTYFFVAMMFMLIVTGALRAFQGDLARLPTPAGVAETGTIGIFLALHAFASGGAAVTGVEAISNGVPTFRPPEWRNARTTLMWMGGFLAVMFTGLSFLAVLLHAMPTDQETLTSQIARAVFGSGAGGTALYLMAQLATMLILILAANTSFAGFPQLASFQARDHFMLRRLTTRGRRLVYSNGILGLAVAASGLILLFAADVHRLIPLYAVGVFTSFTMSQAGMAKRHLRRREPGWRHGLLINGFGAIVTTAVAVIVAATKFAHGAYAVLLFVPLGVWILVRVNRRYEEERHRLEDDLPAFERPAPARPVAVVLVEDLGGTMLHALKYARTIHAAEIRAIHVAGPEGAGDLPTRWAALGLGLPLRVLDHHGDPAVSIAGYVAALGEDLDITVVVPSPARIGWFERARRGRAGSRLTRAVAHYPNVRVTLVRDHNRPEHADAGDEDLRRRMGPRASHDVVVLIDRPDRAVLRAVRYALSMGARQVRAVHAAVDPDVQGVLIERWMSLGIPVDLDLVECWDRDVARSLERYVVGMMEPGVEVTVILPRRDYSSARQRLLHDRTSRRITRALNRYGHVDVGIVPYFLPALPQPDAGAAAGGGPTRTLG
jgi:amino acid transporter